MEKLNLIMTEKPNVILAPHVDDELIGCFRILEEKTVSDVYYFYDLTNERKEEALYCASKYGFNAHFLWMNDIPVDKTVYVPNIHDTHPHHKTVNYISRSLPNKKRYYSVDMNVPFDVLNTNDQEIKLNELLDTFPSQKKLILKDEKYSLFESDLDTDLICFYKSGKFWVQCSECDIPYDIISMFNYKIIQTGGNKILRYVDDKYKIKYI